MAGKGVKGTDKGLKKGRDRARGFGKKIWKASKEKRRKKKNENTG